jgi:hypothetical protein
MAIARSKREAAEAREGARAKQAQQRKREKAEELHANQAQRVRELRQQQSDEAAAGQEKAKLVAEIEARLAARVRGKSFPQVLRSFGVEVQLEDAEGAVVPEAQALGERAASRLAGRSADKNAPPPAVWGEKLTPCMG